MEALSSSIFNHNGRHLITHGACGKHEKMRENRRRHQKAGICCNSCEAVKLKESCLHGDQVSWVSDWHKAEGPGVKFSITVIGW